MAHARSQARDVQEEPGTFVIQESKEVVKDYPVTSTGCWNQQDVGTNMKMHPLAKMEQIEYQYNSCNELRHKYV